MLGRRQDDPPTNPSPSSSYSPVGGGASSMGPTEMRTEPAPVIHKRLGEMLVGERLITPEQLAEAVELQTKSGGFLGQILVRLGYVRQEAVASCLVKQCKIPHLSLLDYDISPDILRIIPEDICRLYHLLPIDKLGRILTVAMVDPLDLDALEIIRAVCPELRIKPILCNWEHFEIVSAKVFKEQRPSGGQAITAQSLGLSMTPLTPKPAAPVTPVVPVAAEAPVSAGPAFVAEAAPRSERVSADSLVDTQAVLASTVREALATALRTMPAPGPSGPTGAELAEILRDSMRETVSVLAGELRTAAPSGGPSADAMASVIREAIGESLQEGLAALVVHLRAESQAHDKGPALNAEQLSAAIRESVSEGMRESMGGLAAQLVKLRAESVVSAPVSVPVAAPTPVPDLQGFGESLRESVAGAMQEALATVILHLRASSPKREEESGNSAAGALAEAVQSFRQALETSQEAQAHQGAQLAQIAEAALQSVRQAAQLTEGAVVGEHTRSDLLRSRQRQHASVAPFGSGSGAAVNPEEYIQSDQEVYDALESEHPVEGLTFDGFYPGTANAFTFKLSRAVASEPGSEYNPFFLYGCVGVGKTHLISAVGNAILLQHPKKRVGYVSASHFSRRLMEAIREQALDAFRENYCHWDVLILDDIQFLGGHVEAQEEFFHIFNVLHQQRRQIIIASDKAPDRLGLLEQRLVSRFASGIVAELKAPEWETRMQILRHHASQSQTPVPEEILSLIAMRVPNDIRKMAGSLKKIVAFAQLVGQEMSCEMADEILSHLGAVAAA